MWAFFKSSPSPSLPRAPSEVMDASALEQALLKSSANKGPSVPQPRSVQNGTNGTSIATLKPDDKGFNVASLFAKLSTSAGSTASARSTPPPAPVIVPLVSLAQTPLPPKDHRSWYALFVDAFLVRLQDRQRAGDLRGPYNPNASEESVRRDMKVYTEMAGMVTGFLPEWFRFDAATRMMYHKIMGDSPDDWMNNEHFLSTYDASQFIEVFVVLRYIAAVVEGPLAGHDEYCSPPSVTLRLKRSS
ncbi:Hypothetical protein, putative [Bodo saltans]|uniref:Uncharacterized protein n=1 Tax=Bodo saltans TaxID=75058 RepID=A0A0S4JLB1_BODSA|nr:Hypothetical protein, putative [Bodo saltans]|eukprot:CUG89265.1 Hypothetical protein, putative [Bodo saltans]